MEFLSSLSSNNRQLLLDWHMCTDLGMMPSPKQVLTRSKSLPRSRKIAKIAKKIALTFASSQYNQVVLPWLYLFSITFITIHCIFHWSNDFIPPRFHEIFSLILNRFFNPFLLWFNEKFCSQEIQFVADCKLKWEHTETELTESWVPGPLHSCGGGELSSTQWPKFG